MKSINYLKNKKILFALGLMLTFGSNIVSAASVIKGKILNQNNEVAHYATAMIINPENMQIVEGDMCDNKGSFEISNILPGTYILSVRMVGYQTDDTRVITVTQDNEIIETGKILLFENTILLGEVNVFPEFKSIKKS